MNPRFEHPSADCDNVGTEACLQPADNSRDLSGSAGIEVVEPFMEWRPPCLILVLANFWHIKLVTYIVPQRNAASYKWFRSLAGGGVRSGCTRQESCRG